MRNKFPFFSLMPPYVGLNRSVLLLAIVGASISAGILAAVKAELALGFVFVLAVVGVLFTEPRLLLYYFLLAGAIDLPLALNDLGPVSTTWMRTTTLAIFFLVYVLLLLANRDLGIVSDDKMLIGAILPWTIYVGLSIMWSASPYDAMRYYPKFIMALFLALALRFERRISSEKAVSLLEKGMVFFLVLSTIAIPFADILWPGDRWSFEGFSGRHQSKFYLVFIALYALSTWMAGDRRKRVLFLGGYSVLLLGLILQRGALLALVTGMAVGYLLALRKISFRTYVVTTLLVAIFVFWAYMYVRTPEFISYGFYPGYDLKDFVSFILNGDLASALRIVNFKGRLEQWSALWRVPKTLLGVGFGTLPRLLAEYFGQYNEVHNDFLQYWIETGYIGFALYLSMWFLIFKIGQKYSKKGDTFLRALGITTASYAAGLFVWSFVDHVFDYTHVTGAYLMILAVLTVKRAQEIGKGTS